VLLQHKSCVCKRLQGFCVVRTQTFVLVNLKNTLIDKNLCGISAFCVEVQKFHTNLCQLINFPNYNTKSLWPFSNTNFLRVNWGQFRKPGTTQTVWVWDFAQKIIYFILNHFQTFCILNFAKKTGQFMNFWKICVLHQKIDGKFSSQHNFWAA
jgi:hypothetical protein